MYTKLLVDAIVHQTTVLIAQLSTAAGIRAPLARVADQVFLELSKEIEAQGVSRKVAADMFGLAIRTYQKKVQRLTESVAARDNTIWQAALEYLQKHGSAPRRALLQHFDRDDPMVVGSVLNDLVSSGLVYKTGLGDTTIYGITRDQDLAQTVLEQNREALAPVVWVHVYRSGGLTLGELRDLLPVEEEPLKEALAILEAEGRVTRFGEGDSAVYRSSNFVVSVNSEHGWEAAVFDHFQTMVRAIGMKVRRGQARSAHDDTVGGATLTFDVDPDHPDYDRVVGLLRQVRSQVNDLWARVEACNAKRPIPEESRIQVSFYFGQCVTLPDQE